MKLDLMYYCQDENMPSSWRLDGCRLGNINLIVGKNASGKSKILRSINFVAGLLSGDVDLKPDRGSREWKLIFDSHNEEDKKVYHLKIDNGKVVREHFAVGSKTYLDRHESGEGRVWAEKLRLDIDFQTPIDEVAAVKRRDSIQHPFFEEIYKWSSFLRYYQFGTDLGRKSMIVMNTKK